ncbi:MAG TPA: alpha/beta hydrolase [Sphingobacterium sp.]|mgnify:CR=1 FL=1|nr:alpha/beta hydrolase [Sphingobacterium sp.]
MKNTFLWIAFLIFAGCSKDNNEPEKVYELVKEELDVSYGDNLSQTMDVYFPEGYDQNTPVVFLIHGGGFIAGAKEHFTPVAKLFVAKGFVAVNLNHRLIDATGLEQQPPLHKLSAIKVVDQVDDMASAVEKFKASANGWGIGTSRMYMAGHSAGGTLAMLYVQGSKNNGIRASGNLAGLANVTLTEELYNNPPDHEYWPAVKELLYRMSGHEVNHSNALALMAISPNWVSNNNKPAKPNITVMAKSNDRDLQFEPYFNTVKDAEDYHNQLRSYDTSSAYILMDTDHGFGNHPDDWSKAVGYTADFFKKN